MSATGTLPWPSGISVCNRYLAVAVWHSCLQLVPSAGCMTLVSATGTLQICCRSLSRHALLTTLVKRREACTADKAGEA